MFLLLTRFLVHGIELLGPGPSTTYTSFIARKLMDSDINLLAFRSVAYSIFPLVMANGLLKRCGMRVDRVTLRRPFYTQCFFVAPFVVMTSVGMTLGRIVGDHLFAGLWIVGVVWYVMVEGAWFARHVAVSRLRGVAIASKLLLRCLVLVASAVVLLALPDIAAAMRRS
jgi:hypothetical protein